MSARDPELEPSDGGPWAGPTHDVAKIAAAPGAEPDGAERARIAELARQIRERGWQGGPLEVLRQDDGALVGFDRRRLLAVQLANEEARQDGLPPPLPDVPVRVFRPDDAFPPPHWSPAQIDELELRAPIRLAADGTLHAGGAGAIAFATGDRPRTMGEAALFRAVLQGARPALRRSGAS